MAHQFESGFFVKEPAWHGLGTVLENKVYSTAEALKLAGADWNVTLHPVTSCGQEISDKKAVHRNDTGAYLATVGKVYRPIQNEDAFKFLDPFLHEKDCFISTAGILDLGKKVWIAAEIENSETEVIEGDRIRNYLLLANSHDGTMKAIVKFVSERVVCANTLRVALGEGGAFRSVSHNSKAVVALSEIQTSLDICRKSFDNTVEKYRQLAATNISTEQFRSYLEGLFESDLKAASKRLDKTAGLEDIRAGRKILAAYDSTPDLQVDGIRGTAYAALNAVGEFVTHGKSSNKDSRFNSIWFGSDANFLAEAEKKVLAMV